jgi:hypothetical protein
MPVQLAGDAAIYAGGLSASTSPSNGLVDAGIGENYGSKE